MPQTAVIPVAEVSCLSSGSLVLMERPEQQRPVPRWRPAGRIDDGIKADGHTVVDTNGGQGVVGTCHDQERQEHADDGGHQPGCQGAQAIDHSCQGVGDHIAHRAQHTQGGNAADEHGQQRSGKEADGFGGDAGSPWLHLGHQQHAQDDGDHGRRIGGVIDGQHEDGDASPLSLERPPGSQSWGGSRCHPASWPGRGCSPAFSPPS